MKLKVTKLIIIIWGLGPIPNPQSPKNSSFNEILKLLI